MELDDEHCRLLADIADVADKIEGYADAMDRLGADVAVPSAFKLRRYVKTLRDTIKALSRDAKA